MKEKERDYSLFFFISVCLYHSLPSSSSLSLSLSPPSFFRVDTSSFSSNPYTKQTLTKLRACEYLVKYHREQNHKIIIFSDDVPALVLICEVLGQLRFIYGGTSENERKEILDMFKGSSLSCIGLSKVGDTALDIPEANVIIQVSSHFGARKQEAQRLGRILRPKPNPTGGFNAFFYTLVSTDTSDMFFSTKRQQYLVDQGYTFQVVQDLSIQADRESQRLTSKKLEMDLLERILSKEAMKKLESMDKAEKTAIDRLEEGEADNSNYDNNNNVVVTGNSNEQQIHTSNNSDNVVIRRTQGSSLSAMSGQGNIIYEEI